MAWIEPTPAPTLAVTFDTQGGSPIAKGATINGGSVTNPGSPTRDGFTFAGWNTAANGTGTTITFPYHHTNSSDFTLYAQWRANSTATPTTVPPTPVPPTTVVRPLIPEELPSTGNIITLWPLLLIAAGVALTTLRRLTHSR
ncbi:MAG: InlB B-repeat-containing protein [Ilumatobacteraceae bacterium]